jgi:hypothetical protein
LLQSDAPGAKHKIFEQLDPVKVKACKELGTLFETEAPLSSLPYLSASCVHFTSNSRRLVFASNPTPQDPVHVVVLDLSSAVSPLELVKAWTLPAQATKRAMAGNGKAAAAKMNGHSNGHSHTNGTNGHAVPTDLGTAALEHSDSEEEVEPASVARQETLAACVSAMASSADGKWLAVADSNRGVSVYNLATLTVRFSVRVSLGADVCTATLHAAERIVPDRRLRFLAKRQQPLTHRSQELPAQRLRCS